MKICRVNVEQHIGSYADVPETWMHLGGRGLIARILLDEVPPTCDPLGPFNKLIFTPGLLVGHMLSSCDRLSVGGKSPLTGGVKESNAGGSTGMAMALLGLHALIFEGWPQDSQWWVVVISQEGVRFDTADDLIGLGVYASAARLIERYGEKVALSLIGPGGEMQMLAAGIQNLDKDRIPSRINARGGLGAVMGSKHIKAVVFDTTGTRKPPIADPAAFKAAQKTYTQALMAHPQTAAYRDYGTAGMARMCNSLGALPTRNFSSGQFESVETISGEHMREELQQRGGDSEPTHACMAGCTIRCSNVYGDSQGKGIVSPLEYETIGLMGSNLGLSDLDNVARLNWQANDLGLDTIDLGAALGVAAEAGMLKFGDARRVLELMGEIRAGTPIGRLLGSGAALTGKALGVRRVPVVKNQAISAYDPRAIKGTGVTYATTPQGADHTCGLTIRAKVDHTNPEGQAALSRTAQINMAGYDTLGACIFAGFGFAVVPETIPALINARYGWDVPPDFLQILGRQTIELEKEFNRRAGFTSADDRLPEWMTQEPLTPTGAVFDVPTEDLDQVHNW